MRGILVGLPLIGIWMFAIFGKLYYLDDEAPYYLWMRDRIHSDRQDAAVVFLGDSAMNSAVNPAALPIEAVSLANGGGCPYEAYYILKEYLEHHGAPKTVYVGYDFEHMTGAGALWERTFYCHLINYRDASELMDAFEETGFDYALADHGRYRRKLLSYYVDYPGVYLAAMTNAGFTGRYEDNMDAWQQIDGTKGHYIGITDAVSLDYTVYEQREYTVETTCDLYIQRLLDLCQEQGIRVRWVEVPMCPNNTFTDTYYERRDGYMNPLVERYNNMTFLPAPQGMQQEQFLDGFHLNNAGCTYYTNFLLESYPEDFAE